MKDGYQVHVIFWDEDINQLIDGYHVLVMFCNEDIYLMKEGYRYQVQVMFCDVGTGSFL